jgi:AcrR family transcriptional regulator
MPRPLDPARRAALLEGAIDYAIANGLADLTLRPLAEALGVMPNTLVHHFGTKEQLLIEILNGVRDRLRELRAEIDAEPGEDPLEGVWRWTSDPEHLPFFRSFFEAYGLALRDPDRFAPFLERVVRDWLADAAEDPHIDAEAATLELAVVRGLLLDLLTTGERARVDGALRLFAQRTRRAGAAAGG